MNDQQSKALRPDEAENQETAPKAESGDEYKQEQEEALSAMEEIDGEIATYPETKKWLGPEAGIRKVAVELAIHVLKTHDPSLSTEDAFKIALPTVLAAEQTVEPRLFKASAGEAIGTLGAMALADSDHIWLGVAALAGTALAVYTAYKLRQDDADTLEQTKDGSTLTIKKPKTDVGGGTGAPMPDPDGDWEKDNSFNDNEPHVNQMNHAIHTGKAPKGVARVDRPKNLFEKIHVHFKNGAALNVDGTWKHGWIRLTNEQIKWLQSKGWTIPK